MKSKIRSLSLLQCLSMLLGMTDGLSEPTSNAVARGRSLIDLLNAYFDGS